MKTKQKQTRLLCGQAVKRAKGAKGAQREPRSSPSSRGGQSQPGQQQASLMVHRTDELINGPRSKEALSTYEDF